jgi:uncharacterized protein (DUF58 family)
MGAFIIAFLVFMVVLASLTQDSFIFNLVYLFAGAYLLGRWWNNQVIKSVVFKRHFTDHAFPGENIPVQIEMENKSRLPAVWFHVQELVPLEIASEKSIQKVVTFPGRGKFNLNYQLSPRRRGYFEVGPIRFSTGDLLGLLAIKEVEGKSNFLTIYPKVFPISFVRLPSQSPLGDLKHDVHIFEDPSRPIGKREYQSGDSLRRIDWKASASVGRLQVKQFEPSIALETTIILNLNPEEYQLKTRFFATELAISIAASLANWTISKKQTVGLITNGVDILEEKAQPPPLPPRKGRSHLMRLLEILARIHTAETESCLTLFHNHRYSLSWGTTVIVITGQADEKLFNEFYTAKKTGLHIVLILCGEVVGLQEIKKRAEYFKIPMFYFLDERDLNIWQN